MVFPPTQNLHLFVDCATLEDMQVVMGRFTREYTGSYITATKFELDDSCHVFGILMLLAFAIDQLQQHCCGLFQAAVKKAGSRARFWRRQQSIFTELYIASWEDLFLWMIDRGKGRVTIEDTS